MAPGNKFEDIQQSLVAREFTEPAISCIRCRRAPGHHSNAEPTFLQSLLRQVHDLCERENHDPLTFS
jgi:hypothetical protein